MKYVVTKEAKLLEYLLEVNKELSNKKIKTLLKYSSILVNGKCTTKYDYPLKEKDIITFGEEKAKRAETKLNIIFEDNDIIVVNKPYGLLTISTEKEKEKTLYKEVSDYIKLSNKKGTIFIVHRLDKDTSGVVLFAKSERVKLLYQDDWNELVKKREYVAVVEGSLEKKEGRIESYLTENAANMVYKTNSRDGKLAITNYKVIRENLKYSLVSIDLETGRKNQIRVHMSDLGHPIVGDRKYGGQISPIKRLCLHANCLELINPITKKLDKYSAPTPENLKWLLK